VEKREPALGSCGAALLANRRRLAAKLLGKDEARRIAANIGEIATGRLPAFPYTKRKGARPIG